jgi:release factor glutamine methyltransferase
MTASSNLAPLLVSLQLTPEQQELIRERIGVTVPALPYESSASVARYPFAGLELRVNRGVFSPSHASERAVKLAVDAAADDPHPQIIEVGTGCGAISLAIAVALPASSVIATEISETAIRCARLNRDRLRLRNVMFRRGSLLSPVPQRLRGQASVIVANLPYIPPRFRDSAGGFFPPGTAMGVGDDGLELVRQTARDARKLLRTGGTLVLQLAGFQWEQFIHELRTLGYAVQPLGTHSPNAPAVEKVVWPGAI